MNLPHGVKTVISVLERHGHRADVVGGCVRDFLLGAEPHDYDVTTDATPDEMHEIFQGMRTLDTGIKHGTLTVIVDSEPYEVTTYRLDGAYSDNRHPDTVSFTRRLRDDLSRRDFTVNAMCYNERDGVTDMFGGREDLEHRLIRAVGEPAHRFDEDALRILRALRFASVLGFGIEKNTSLAIHEKKKLLAHVSRERIFTEWKKLVGGAGAYEIISEYGDVIGEVIPELSEPVLPPKSRFIAADPAVRELSLFALKRPDNAPDLFLHAMTSLRSDNKRKSFGAQVLELSCRSTDSDVDLKRLVADSDAVCARATVALKYTLGACGEEKAAELEAVLNSGCCLGLPDLNVCGSDLAALGLCGSAIGKTLKELLYEVIEGKTENSREALLSRVTKEL